MTSRVTTRNAAIVEPEQQPTSVDSAQTREIIVELDSIVGQSHRRSRLRRAVHGVGEAFVRWLDGLVPPASAARDTDPTPLIKFPFF